MEDLIRKREVWFPPCKASQVMWFATRADLVEAIRKGEGPKLPKKKKPIFREDLPDLDFWIGKPIAPGRPSKKDFLKNKTKMAAPISSWIAGQKEQVDYLYDESEEAAEFMRSPRGGEGSDAIVEILGYKAFDHPKPPSLIYGLVKQATGPNDLVMDFFAGSGTTAQAVLQLNKEEGDAGKRRFILVSSTEATTEEPEKNVCRDVCAARVRNVINGYGKAPALGGDFAYLRSHRIPIPDLLDIDHAHVWNALQLMDRDDVQPFVAADFSWSGDSNSALCYVPRFHRSMITELRRRTRETESLIIYSWQPTALKQHIGDSHVMHAHVAEALARRFCLNLTPRTS
jgi:adenine-specific DNA-methyltransferase